MTREGHDYKSNESEQGYEIMGSRLNSDKKGNFKKSDQLYNNLNECSNQMSDDVSIVKDLGGLRMSGGNVIEVMGTSTEK